eukprot:5073476-Prymnesium_polylepis.1
MGAEALEKELSRLTVALNTEIEEVRDCGAAAAPKLAELNEQSARLGSMTAKLKALAAATESPIEALFAFGGSELSETLDAEKGATITDHEIFNAHARFWEKAYLDDMTSLGVKAPDVMTRVTEYVPRIIDFVAKIVDKGLAYSSNVRPPPSNPGATPRVCPTDRSGRRVFSRTLGPSRDFKNARAAACARRARQGSVYLDIDAFKSRGHHYRKLS